ncbi:MAG: hypothetical protein IJ105_04260 [Bacilli bacterium]|nr:hypothetical protein [Bacilli bacterium]
MEKENINNSSLVLNLDEILQNEKKQLINDIKSVFVDLEIDGLYEFDGNMIKLNPDYYLNEDIFNRRIKKDIGMYYDLASGEGNEHYKPIHDISQEEFDYLESIDFEPEKYNELIKNKMINHMNIYLDNKITDFKMSDIVPLEYRLCEYLSKYYENMEYDPKDDIMDENIDEAIYRIKSLSNKYNFKNSITDICNYIENTKNEIKIPKISKDKMLELIEGYKEENQIEETIDYEEYIEPIIYDIQRKKKKEILERRFEKQKLEEAKKELKEQKGMLDSTIDSNGPKM